MCQHKSCQSLKIVWFPDDCTVAYCILCDCILCDCILCYCILHWDHISSFLLLNLFPPSLQPTNQPTCQHAMSSIAFTRLFNSFHITVVAIITLSTCNIFHNIVLVVLVKSITVSRFSNHSSLSRASTSLSAYSWFRVNAVKFDIKPNQFFHQN